MKDNLEFSIKPIKRSCKNHVMLLILILFLTLVLTCGITYYSLKVELEREIDEAIDRTDKRLAKKITFYKSILINTVKKIEEKSLFNKPNIIYKLLLRNYQLLQKHNKNYETITIKWIGRHPHNYEIDQFGIQRYYDQKEIDSVDDKGISSKITDDINGKSYKLCLSLSSPNIRNLGYVCLIENLQDLFDSVKEKGELIITEPVYTTISLNQNSFIFIKQKPQKDLNNQVNIVSKVFQAEFRSLLLKRLFLSLASIPFLGVVLFLILFSFCKKALLEFQNLDKYINASKCEYKAIIDYISSLERRLNETLEGSKQQLKFIIQNARNTGNLINLFNTVDEPYNIGKIALPITTDDIKSILKLL